MSGSSLRPQIVIFGSSVVQYGFYDEGWIATLFHLYARKADIVLRGYAGWNSRRALQVLDKIFPKDAPVQPSLVIAYFGGNDSSTPHSSGLGPYVPLQEYIENMRKIIIHLKSLSENTRILVLNSPPIDDTLINCWNESSDGNPSRTNEACGIYSEACLDVCRKMNIKAIDLWSTIQNRNNWEDVCFLDGIHLSNEGSKIVSKEILTILKEVEWVPNLHWRSMLSEFGEDSPYDPVAPDGKSTVNISNFAFPNNDYWD
ncbi:hypothetical protein Fmac_011502 [Flemingia macrophylla]|uniref:SGNH hydrolase-type esterase domain-containing protein n=1 Tax=Flemingia macrophylla TaxID=520843 RepID=A0ABD1MML9_9FABA